MKALSLKVYSFALTSLPNGFSHLSAFLYFKSFWNNQMHCEIIDCYFSTFFVELKLKRENLKNGFGQKLFGQLIKGGGGGVWLSKNLAIFFFWGGEVPKILLERGDNPERGGCHFLITLMFDYIYCVCGLKVKFPLLHFGSSVFWVNHARFSSKSL